MIHVLFPAGAFGSTIEYCIRRFSREFDEIPAEITPDGSMHSFAKERHPVTLRDLKELRVRSDGISTPVYPNVDMVSPLDTIAEFKSAIYEDDRVIFVVFPEIRQVIRNRLFAYFKINLGLSWPVVDPSSTKYVKWNPKYTSAADMERWEQREMLSLEFQGFSSMCTVTEASCNNWLIVTPDDFLNNFSNTIKRILVYLDLTLVDEDGLQDFGKLWVSKQQYILDHFKMLEAIVDQTITKSSKNFSWNSLDLVSEALLQYMLRLRGYDTVCYGLNEFPTSTHSLRGHIKPLA